MTLTPEERTAGKLAAVHFALRGATIKDLMGSIDPGDGVILVESLTIKTVDGHTLGLAARGDGFTIFRMDRADPAKSVFDLIPKEDPCAGCPGVEGGCSEHPAECGRYVERGA